MLANGGWDLTLILLTWTIWRAPTNASKWRMGFNSAFKGLKCILVEGLDWIKRTQDSGLLWIRLWIFELHKSFSTRCVRIDVTRKILHLGVPAFRYLMTLYQLIDRYRPWPLCHYVTICPASNRFRSHWHQVPVHASYTGPTGGSSIWSEIPTTFGSWTD